ncbi:chemotaxis protein [Thermosipho melanesiensis]|uniref:Methyl-accepting chemotaxis sensory transducer n=2 Tax=Thermosipho melanesiensis TaxID=46541 RepID=A6LM48_THEM4|nr:methyl-accepting chemotaxis protein [Thermosipho melanesiensis]ABR30999.1 methyl-accepting chemotaxis sensory transducer [Thermosipho melanesiensis BI429]APT74096.1 chemotaxis protein [Thermosipho melanesiensis]OOC36041.1 chemotaxis protein [Thermosipho melanesiensis]OOC36858.1 chemotaxis protein [Thermosipho melanesiensis]OOC37609.1 chemotaxis protein [Thermosipho melanesiensis]
MKKYLKFTLYLSVSILAVIWILAFTLVIPYFTDSVKNVALSQFKNNLKILIQTKNYDTIFSQNYFEYYYLISPKGITLNHSDKTKIGADFSEIFPDFFKYMKEKKEGTYEYTYKDTKRIAAFAYDGENYLVISVKETDLFAPVYSFKKLLYFLILPLITAFTIIFGYLFGIFINRQTSKDFSHVLSLLSSISEDVFNTSSSTNEIKSMAENTENAMNELDKSIEDFAAFVEENTAELESSLNKIMEFTQIIKDIIDSSSKLSTLADVLSNLTEKITDISDTITVLAINASIETSKENIDREGLSRIAEMIMELSNNTRELAKNSRKSLLDIEDIITSTILLSEKASKEIYSVNDSLNAVKTVNNSTLDNIDKLTKISRTTHDAMEELYAGLEQVEEAINSINKKVQEFEEQFKYLKGEIR